LILLASNGCAVSNLDQRPICFKNPYGDDPETVEIRSSYPASTYLLATGMGRAPEGQLDKAEDAAEAQARQSLMEIILSEVKSWVEERLQMIDRNGVQQYSRTFESFVRISTEGILSGSEQIRKWDGFDHGDTVTFVLMALHKPTAKSAIENAVLSELSAAEGLKESADSALRRKDFAGMVHNTADLFTRTLQLMAQLGNLHFFAGETERERVLELSTKAGTLHGFALAQMGSIRKLTEENCSDDRTMIRGGSNPRIRVKPKLDLDSGSMDLSGCQFRVIDSARNTKTGKVMRTDSDGILDIPLAVGRKTARGSHDVNLTVLLCDAHQGQGGRSSGCSYCEFEKQLSLSVNYTVVPDYEEYERLYMLGEKAAKQGEFARAKQFYSDAAEVVFDDSSKRRRAEKRHSYLSTDEALAQAEQMQKRRSYPQAIEAYSRAWSLAKKIPDRVYADQILAKGAACASEYCTWENRNGDEASRERCFSCIMRHLEEMDSTDLRQIFQQLLKKLPCKACGRSAKCTKCRGKGSYTGKCDCCRGSGKVDEDCPTCRAGRIDCSRCRGKCNADSKKCDRCNGQGKYDCPDCLNGWRYSRYCGWCGGRGCNCCSGSGFDLRSAYVCYSCRGYG